MQSILNQISNSANIGQDRCACGGSHTQDQHWRYTSEMPQTASGLVDAYLQMGLYDRQTVALAENLSKAELMESLFIQNVAGEDPLKRSLCEDMIAEAGGLDAALSAAFGIYADEFLDNTLQRQSFSRRRFLEQITIAAGLLALGFSSQAMLSDRAESQAGKIGKLEKTKLRIGFIPITCATPILMSKPLGFYTKYGLEVELVKMPSWAAVRDSAIAGELDAYHMLTPMPIALSIGLGSTTFPVKLASIENIHGQSIVLANKHKDKVKSPKDFKGLTIGIPFPFSMHNLLIRYYLATGGLNPDRDVQLQIIPPADALAKMTAGQLDAFLLPDNVGQ